MELQTVNREIALKLKELGFYLDTNGKFNNIDNLKTGRTVINPDFSDPKEFYFDNEKAILIPTQSLVVKWLREVHQIIVEPYPDDFYRKEYIRYWVFIHTVENKQRFGLFETYEQAEETGIIEALKLIKIND